MSAILLVSAFTGGCKKETVQQAEATLSLSPSTAITYESEGGATVITVKTNQDSWKAVSDQDWCTVTDLSDTSFSVTAKANTGKEPLPEATVTVTAGRGNNTKTATLKVNQRGTDDPVQPKAFTVEVSNITSTSADMKVIPFDTDAVYFYNIVSEDLLKEKYSADPAVYMVDIVDEAVEIYGGMEEAFRKIGARGIQLRSFTNLAPATEYIAFAAGLDGEGKVNTEIVRKEFITEAAASEVTFDMDFTNIYYDGMDFTLTPSDEKSSYYLAIRPAFQYEELSDAELLEKIIFEDGLTMHSTFLSGIYEYTNDSEEEWRCSDTGYIVIVFGWADGKPTSDLHKFPFRTLPSNLPPSECTFEIMAAAVTPRSAYVSVSPSDDTAAFMWNIVTEATYEEHKADMKRYVTDYVAQNITELDYTREMGETAASIDYTLYPGTTYYVWAACIDEFGKPASDIHLSEPFTTLPNSGGTAAVNAVIGKYFDGDELHALDPERYAEGVGKAYVRVEFSATEDALLWYGYMIKEDPENPTTSIPDDEIVAILQQRGTLNPFGEVYWCDWGAEYTLLGVAIDQKDNNGPVFRLSKTFTKEGASPLSEFVQPLSSDVKYIYEPPFAG